MSKLAKTARNALIADAARQAYLNRLPVVVLLRKRAFQ